MATAPTSNGLNVEVIGTGHLTTVLMHGFLGSGKNLRPLARLWSERDPERKLVLVDLPGHGESMALGPGATLCTMARSVLEGVQALAFSEPFALVGHSLGGRVGLAALKLEPMKVASATLLDIGPGPIDPAQSESRRVLDILLDAPEIVTDRSQMRAFLMERGLSKALSDWILMNLKALSDEGSSEFTWRIDRRALAELHSSFNLADLWPVVERFGPRIACARGERSAYVSLPDVKRLQANGVRVQTLAGAGHYVHVDALPELLDWLQIPL